MATAPAMARELDRLAVPDVMKTLDVDSQKGLTSSEAQSRLAKYGPNALEEKKKS
jgi:H+-transporting ATPase